MRETIRIERNPGGVSMEDMVTSVYWAGRLGTYTTAMDLLENLDVLEEIIDTTDPSVDIIHFPGTRETRYYGSVGFSVHPVLRKDAHGRWTLHWSCSYTVGKPATCLTH